MATTPTESKSLGVMPFADFPPRIPPAPGATFCASHPPQHPPQHPPYTPPDLSECIKLYGEAPGPNPGKPSPTLNPLCHTCQAPTPSASKEVVKAFAKIFYDVANPLAFMWKTHDGRIFQTSREELTKHLLTVYAGTYHHGPDYENPHYYIGNPANKDNAYELTKDSIAAAFTKKRIEAMLAGTGIDRALYIRSDWMCRKTLCRIDIDTHKPHQDDQEAVKAWVNDLLGGLPWWTASERGLSGYFFIDTPMYTNERTGEEKPIVKRTWINEWIVAMQAGLAAMANARGFRCGIEVKGGILITDQEREPGTGVPLGPKTLVQGTLNGKYSAKLPRLYPHHTLEDAAKLAGAVASPYAKIFKTIIETGEAAMPAEKKRKEDFKAAMAEEEDDDYAALTAAGTSTTYIRRLAQKKKKRGPLVPTGDTMRDTWNVAVEAKVALGIKTKAEMISRRDEHLDLMQKIWELKGFPAPSDKKRQTTRFRGSQNLMIRTFSNRKAQGGGKQQDIWFTTPDDGPRNDIDELMRHLSGTGLKTLLEEKNAWLEKYHPECPPLTEKAFGLVACTIAKNSEINRDGGRGCGGKAIKRMCKYFDVLINGTLIKAVKDILANLKVVWCTRAPQVASETTKGVAAGYTIFERARAWFHFIPQGAQEPCQAEKNMMDQERRENEKYRSDDRQSNDRQDSNSGSASVFFSPKYKVCLTLNDEVEDEEESDQGDDFWENDDDTDENDL